MKDGRQEPRAVLLSFGDSGELYLRRREGRWTFSAEWAVVDGRPACQDEATLPQPVAIKKVEAEAGSLHLFFSRHDGKDSEATLTLEELRETIDRDPGAVAPELAEVVASLTPADVVRAAYLEKGKNDYIYQFRTERQRNRGVYRLDERSESLYQSGLCEAIKAARRVNERSSGAPAELDFGPVSYILPSHFGFCLGVQNAIERAYECLAENPGRTVYMLSELIHNPFVNEDLKARGLRCLQSDRGEPLRDETTGRFYWDLLGKDDIVVIPAFGATDEDKARLIEKGIEINRYDATCMLVEKVWKAAERFGDEGYTVIIHGKAEHEETKATFSNAAKNAPSLVVRDREEARLLADIIRTPGREEKERKFAAFAGRHTQGFDVGRDLDRIAVVNQTTLLRNETLHIIEILEAAFAEKFGPDQVAEHINSNSKGDTLCYATQVNQDALEKALGLDPDLAIVAGGRNSSNTYQLYRMCEARLGNRAFYVQSEKNILSTETILHHRYSGGAAPRGEEQAGEKRSFLPPAGETGEPVRILLTGGASCPDGILQRIISHINGFFPPERVRTVEAVVAGSLAAEGRVD